MSASLTLTASLSLIADESWLEQIEDNQDPPSQLQGGAGEGNSTQFPGSVPDCVPYYGGHCHLPSSPSWGTAYPTLANWVFEYYDDLALVQKHYEKVKAYAVRCQNLLFVQCGKRIIVSQDSLTARAAVMDKANHTLLDSGGWGDWMAPNGNPDDQLSARDSGSGGGGGTCGGSYEYISALRTVVAWANATGNAADLSEYGAREAKVSAAFHAEYFDEESGYDCPSTRVQTANALGMQVSGDARGLAALVEDASSKDNHLE